MRTRKLWGIAKYHLMSLPDPPASGSTYFKSHPQVDSRPSSVTEKPNQVPIEKIASERRISNRPVQTNRRHRSSEEDSRNEYQNQYQNRKEIEKQSSGLFFGCCHQWCCPLDSNELYADALAMEQMQSLNFVQKMLVEESSKKEAPRSIRAHFFISRAQRNHLAWSNCISRETTYTRRPGFTRGKGQVAPSRNRNFTIQNCWWR